LLSTLSADGQDGGLPLGEGNIEATGDLLSADNGAGAGLPGAGSPDNPGGDQGNAGSDNAGNNTNPGGDGSGGGSLDTGASSSGGNASEPSVLDQSVVMADDVQSTEVTAAEIAALGEPPPAPDDGREYILLLDIDENGKPSGYTWAPLAGDGSGPLVITNVVVVVPSPAEPCVPSIDTTNIGLQFDCPGDAVNGINWGWALNAWARVPPHTVERSPFPRGLVTVPNTFILRRLLEQYGRLARCAHRRRRIQDRRDRQLQARPAVGARRYTMRFRPGRIDLLDLR
jgi:hypothetical protein